MAKKINEVIEDRIEDGRDAWRIKLKMAGTSPYQEVVDHALVCLEKLQTAEECLSALADIRDRCEAHEREAKRNGDPRQEGLDLEERCGDCANAELLEPDGDGERALVCKVIGEEVEPVSTSAEMECESFEAPTDGEETNG